MKKGLNDTVLNDKWAPQTRKSLRSPFCDKLYAQTPTLWTVVAVFNENLPIGLHPSGLASWTFAVNLFTNDYMGYSYAAQ